MADKGSSSKFCYLDSSGADKSLRLSLVVKNPPVLPSRKKEDREFFMYLHPLNCLQLKTVLSQSGIFWGIML